MSPSSTHTTAARPVWKSLGSGVLRFADGINTYLVRSGPGRAIVIDPGEGRWWTQLPEIAVHTVDAVLLTHVHRDVACGLYRPGPLSTQFDGPVWVPSGDADLAREEGLETFWQNYQAAGCPASYAAPRTPFPQSLRVIGGDSELLFGDLRLCAISTPGHTRGALSYLLRHGERQFAFCGDAAHSGATLHQLYHLEWDHWTPEGVLQAWYGLERLRGNRIDLLLPSHGSVVRRTPHQMLETLQQRLLRLVSAKTAIASGEPSRWLDTETIAAGVERILPNLYAFGHNGYALVDEEGHALIVDPHVPDLDALERLIDDTGLVPEIATATHYHVDHSDGLENVRGKYGAEVWLHPWVAEPLCDRNRLDIPWLTKDSIAADRILPEEGRVRWRGCDLGVRPYPGQTWWHCALDTVVAGKGILFSGDNFQPPSRWNGTGGFCAFNRSRFTDGFARSAQAGLEVAPDIVCNGHGCLYTFDADHHRAILAWSKEAEAAVAALCPSRAWTADYDPRVIRVEPFVVQAHPGQRISVEVVVENPSRRPLTLDLQPQGIACAALSPPRRRLTVKPGATRRMKLELQITRSAAIGRKIVAIDATVDGVPRPEACVCLVDVGRRESRRARSQDAGSAASGARTPDPRNRKTTPRRRKS